MTDKESKCPKCETPMKFTATMKMKMHGMCDFWKCPGCGKITIFNEAGQIVENISSGR